VIKPWIFEFFPAPREQLAEAWDLFGTGVIPTLRRAAPG
jgi:hypothetical protein